MGHMGFFIYFLFYGNPNTYIYEKKALKHPSDLDAIWQVYSILYVIIVTLHRISGNKVNTRTQHARTLKQKN